MPFWVKLTSAIKRDPKKVGVLVVLTVLLGLALMRTLGPSKPRRASAAPASPTLNAGSRGGSGNVAVSRQTTRAIATGTYLRQWAEPPIPPVSRNLFAVRLEYFPVDSSRSGAAGVKSGGDEGFWARLEKSLALQADQRDKRENQIANYTARAAQLRLQSTMMGPQPKALVNGEFVGEGDVVADFFRVVKIEARRMIVEREGIRLEIQMK